VIVPARDPTVGDLVALDPSISSSGVALFRAGVLRLARRVVVLPEPDAEPECVAARCLRMAQRCAALVVDAGYMPRFIALEWPQVYAGAKAKGDPNDLPGLAGVGMAFAGILALAMASRNQSVVLQSWKPGEWAGQLPKVKKGDAWLSPRGQRIKARLSPEEVQAAGGAKAQHDVLDSVGLGLYAVGRFERARVFAGAAP
jgi:hypothetical protein